MKKKKKLLVVNTFFYPAYKAGGPVQSLKYLLVALKEDYDIYVLTSDCDIDGSQLDVISNQWNHTQYGQVYYTTNLSLKLISQIRKEVTPSVVYLNSFFSPTTVKYLLVAGNNNIVIAPRGEFAKNALAGKSLKKNLYLYLYRLFLDSSKIKWHFTNQSERDDASSVISLKNNYIIAYNLHAIEVNDDFFCQSKKAVGQVKIVCLGRVCRMKNMTFIIDVLSKVQGKVICDIYGAIENKEYYSLCLDKIKSLPESVVVNFKGEVHQDDTIKIMSRYDLFFSPSLGENFGHAVLEGVISGLPLLISNKIPFFNDVEKYNAGIIADLNCIQEFVDAIDNFITYDQSASIEFKKNIRLYLKDLDKRINDIENYKKLL